MKDVIADVLLKNQKANYLIKRASLVQIKVNVFRYTQSLDDSTLIFWRPRTIRNGEWPYIYFLKLEEGRVIANTDLESPIQKIVTNKVKFVITILEMANKQFFYGWV